MLDRLKEFVKENNVLVEEQSGFRSKYSTVDSIFVLSAKIEAALRRRKGRLYCLFVDYSKAFDRVERDMLWYKLIRCGVLGYLIRGLMAIYSSVKCIVKVCGQVGEDFACKTGLDQCTHP